MIFLFLEIAREMAWSGQKVSVGRVSGNTLYWPNGYSHTVKNCKNAIRLNL